MQVNNVNNTSYNPQFRAIFKLRNDGSCKKTNGLISIYRWFDYFGKAHCKKI